MQLGNCKQQTVTSKLQTQIIKLQSAIYNIETVICTMQSAMCYLQYTVRDCECQVITLGHKKGVAITLLYGHCWYEDFQLLVARQFFIGFLFQIQFQIWFQIQIHIKYQMTCKQKSANCNLQWKRASFKSFLLGIWRGLIFISNGHSCHEEFQLLVASQFHISDSVLNSITDWVSDSNPYQTSWDWAGAQPGWDS